MTGNKMKNIKIKIYNSISNEDKEEFCQWALKNKLYRNIEAEPDLKKDYNSRMKLVFEGKKEAESLTVALAFDGNKPIGILMCENKLYKRDIEFLPSYKRKPRKLDAEGIVLGFLSFYVLPEYRNNGIAAKLLVNMEKEKSKLLIANKEKGFSLMGFEARGDAIKIISKSKYSSIINGDYQQQFNNYGYKTYLYLYLQENEGINIEPSIEEVEKFKTSKITMKKILALNNIEKEPIKMKM